MEKGFRFRQFEWHIRVYYEAIQWKFYSYFLLKRFLRYKTHKSYRENAPVSILSMAEDSCYLMAFSFAFGDYRAK